MAKVKTNVLLEGLSGRVGELVFKNYGDKIVVCRGAGGELRIGVRDNVGVRRVTVAVDDCWEAAEPLETEPASVWRWRLTGSGPWAVRVRAEDGMGNVGEWAGVVVGEGS